MSNKTINLNFNPKLNGSVEATVTTHSDKSLVYYMSDTSMMMLSSKPNIKSIKVINKYDANTPGGINAFNEFKEKLKNN
ncbi:MAG: hypothetical protein H8D94_00725 [Candidatus Pelagibacter sp.]|nr:hypothetical protein [Candidatus Pelagibacter sp.]